MMAAIISERRIEQDLALLSQRFECVRTYSVTGLAVPKVAGKFGLKVLLGAGLSPHPVATRKELERVIALANSIPPWCAPSSSATRHCCARR